MLLMLKLLFLDYSKVSPDHLSRKFLEAVCLLAFKYREDAIILLRLLLNTRIR